MNRVAPPIKPAPMQPTRQDYAAAIRQIAHGLTLIDWYEILGRAAALIGALILASYFLKHVL